MTLQRPLTLWCGFQRLPGSVQCSAGSRPGSDWESLPSCGMAGWLVLLLPAVLGAGLPQDKTRALLYLARYGYVAPRSVPAFITGLQPNFELQERQLCPADPGRAGQAAGQGRPGLPGLRRAQPDRAAGTHRPLLYVLLFQTTDKTASCSRTPRRWS